MICPECGRRFGEGKTTCPDDGATLLSMGPAGSRRTSGSLAAGPSPPPEGSTPRRSILSGPVVIPRPLGQSAVGTTVGGRYVIEARIGSGGMGVVYRARQLLVDRTVALKILPRDLAEDPVAAKRFLNEARSISQLRHPNIVTLYDFGVTDDGRPFIAMEFVDGETLGARLKRGPMPAHEVVHVARCIAEALAAAHDMGLIHRDIKGDNVMIERRTIRADEVRVLDFGIARTVDSDHRLTQTGMVFGTPQYCSPEQAMGQPLDGRSDLYSLGILLFEMLAGRGPFADGPPAMLLHKHINEPPPRLRAQYPEHDVPRELDALVDRLLQKDPARRPGTAREVVAALDTVGHGSAAGPVSGPTMAASAPTHMTGHSVNTQALAALETPSGELTTDHVGGPRPGQAGAQGSRLALWLALGLGGAAGGGAVWLASTGPEPDESLHSSRPREVPSTTPMRAALPPPTTNAPRSAPPSPPAVPPRLVAALTGPLEPAALPMATEPGKIQLPLPAPVRAGSPAPPTPGASASSRVADLRRALQSAPAQGPVREDLLFDLAAALWGAANENHTEAMKAYEAQRQVFLEGRGETPPVAPRPNYVEATEAFEALLSAAPKGRHVEGALFHAGVGALGAGRREAAMTHLARLVHEHPEGAATAQVRLAVADHLLLSRSFDAAAALYAREAGAAGDRGAHARLMAAHAEYGRGRFEEAVRAFQRVLEQPAESPALAAYQAESALEGLTVTYTRLPDGDSRARDAFRARLGEAGAVERLITMARLLETTDVDASLRLYGRLVDEHAATLPSESLRSLLHATSALEDRTRKPDTSTERLERLSARPDLSVTSRIEVLLALARARVAQGGQADAARAALRTAKGLLPPTPAAPGAAAPVPPNLAARVALAVAMLDLEALAAEPALPADSPRRLAQVLEDDQRKADALERLVSDALAQDPALAPEADALRVRLLARVADRCVAALAASPEGPNAKRVAARESAARGEAERLLALGHIDPKSAEEAQALLRRRP